MTRTCYAVAFCAAVVTQPSAWGQETAPDGNVLKKHLTAQGYTAVPLIRGSNNNDGMALVDGKLDGKPMRLLIDSGASLSVCLSVAAANRMGFAAAKDLDPKESLNGVITARHEDIGRVGEIRVGSDYRVRNTNLVGALEGFQWRISARDPTTGAVVEVKYDGILGTWFLHDNCAVLDLADSTLYLMPWRDRELRRLRGAWKGVRAEKDGIKLEAPADFSLAVRADSSASLRFGKAVRDGYFVPAYRDGLSVVYYGARDETGEDFLHAIGTYEIEGDRLKLCVIEKPPKKLADDYWKKWQGPTQFKTWSASGYVLYEFERQPQPATADCKN